MDKRIIDIKTTITLPEDDDFYAVDSKTKGTRKISAAADLENKRANYLGQVETTTDPTTLANWDATKQGYVGIESSETDDQTFVNFKDKNGNPITVTKGNDAHISYDGKGVWSRNILQKMGKSDVLAEINDQKNVDGGLVGFDDFFNLVKKDTGDYIVPITYTDIFTSYNYYDSASNSTQFPNHIVTTNADWRSNYGNLIFAPRGTVIVATGITDGNSTPILLLYSNNLVSDNTLIKTFTVGINAVGSVNYTTIQDCYILLQYRYTSQADAGKLVITLPKFTLPSKVYNDGDLNKDGGVLGYDKFVDLVKEEVQGGGTTTTYSDIFTSYVYYSYSAQYGNKWVNVNQTSNTDWRSNYGNLIFAPKGTVIVATGITDSVAEQKCLMLLDANNNILANVPYTVVNSVQSINYTTTFDCYILLQYRYTSQANAGKLVVTLPSFKMPTKLLSEDDLNKISAIPNMYSIEAYTESSDAGDYALAVNRIMSQFDAGIINFGVGSYRFDSQVVITKNFILQGKGCSNTPTETAPTTIYTNSPVLDIFLNQSAIPFVFRDIHFANRASTVPTKGSAIRVAGDPSILNSQFGSCNGYEISRCSFDRFYDNIYSEGGAEFFILNNSFIRAVRYNLYVENTHWQDNGDARIFGNHFYNKNMQNQTQSDPTFGVAHIFTKGSGGMRIIGNKFNDYIQYAIQGNIEESTSIFLCTGNSFENYKKGAIQFGNDSYNFKLFIVTSNEFAGYNSNVVDVSIKNVSNAVITSNVHRAINSGCTAININKCDNVQVCNTYEGYSKNVNTYNSTNINTFQLLPISSDGSELF